MPFVFLFLLCFKTVASWRMSQQLQHCQCQTVCTLGPTSAAQTSGEKASPSHEKHTQLRKLQQIENVSVCSYHYDTCACLPSQPSTYYRSPSLMGVAFKKAATRQKTDHESGHATICNVRKLAAECPEFHWRNRPPLSPDRGI